MDPLLGELNCSAREYIRDPMFWVQLDALRELLQPIDKALKMSKSDKGDLGHVIPGSKFIRIWTESRNPLLTLLIS